MPVRRIATALLAALLGAAWAAPSHAQYELGTGNELDANPAFGGSRLNPSLAAPNFAGRNLLVTGNVAGGRGFRGTVGYTAEYDFRGQTGSDDLFAERALAAFSAPSFIAAGTSVENLRFGQYLNEVEYRTASRGATIANVNDQPFRQTGSVEDERLALDRVAISSQSSSIYSSARDAQIIGLLRDEEGNRITATASSLTGLQLSYANQVGQFIGLNTYDMVRTLDDVQDGRMLGTVGQSFEFEFENLIAAARNEPELSSGLVEPPTESALVEPPVERSYLEIMQEIADRQAVVVAPEAESGRDALADLDRRFTELREELMAGIPPQEEIEDGETPPPAGLPRALTGEGPIEEMTDRDAATEIESIAAALRHGRRIDRLAGEDPSRFNELMTAAQESLRDGEYFWAERRFERALRFTPGHPMATAGLGHAQIGAGLHLPAALTLRRLLTEHPEMIDVRYAAALLPSQARLSLAVSRLRELINDVQRDRDLHGFLLAYIGHQLDDPRTIAEGLDVMGEGPLAVLLREVWLGAGDVTVPESEAPNPAANP